jgi:hypothetical protein
MSEHEEIQVEITVEDRDDQIVLSFEVNGELTATFLSLEMAGALAEGIQRAMNIVWLRELSKTVED